MDLQKKQNDFQAPKKIAVLLYPGVEPMDFQGSCAIFDLWHLENQGPEVILVSPSSEPIFCAYGRALVSQYHFANCPDFDVLLVPGGKGRKKMAQDPALLDFLVSRSENCKYMMSVCTGIFLLAAAGLATGHVVTTHWELIEELSKDSRLDVRGDQRVVQDGKVWSAAGIFSGIDLALSFIDHFEGTLKKDGSIRKNEAGHVQAIAQYFPSSTRYPQGAFLEKLPEKIQKILNANADQ